MNRESLDRRSIMCDGCSSFYYHEQVILFMVQGAQVRYCADCAEHWKALETAVNAEVAKCQRIADLAAMDLRAKSPLILVPFDFPKIACDAAGNPVVLR